MACDPQRSVVVEACAGAGKTWMLVSRILRALLDGAEPNEVLAITFTRKAAGEMRSRLDEWLAEFSSAACSDEARVTALRLRGLSESDARSKAPALAGLRARLLRSGRSVEVRTFHAWFSQLLRAAPLELLAEMGMHREMELVEDVSAHAAAIFRRFHAAVSADAALRADFQTLVQARGRAQLRKWLGTALERRVEIELADKAGVLEASVSASAERWPEFAGFDHPAERIRHPAVLAGLAEIAETLAKQKGVLPKKQGAKLADALGLEHHGPCLAAVRRALLTQNGTLRKALDVPRLQEAAGLLEDIAAACKQHEARSEHLRMVRLARCLFAEFADYKRAQGLADMSDLECGALQLLRDGTLAGWVQERLDARVRHVLIDEFQDTSPLQWHALQSWLSGYAGAGGGASGQRPPGVFIVGDPKQSIYRFRRAEPRVFDAARDFVRHGLDGHVLACDHTRRNAPAVVAAINEVFSAAQASAEFSGFRPHTTAVEDAPSTSPVRRLPRIERETKAASPFDEEVWRDTLRIPRHEPDEMLRQQEAAAVAQAVRALIVEERVLPGEIQVLCRKRETLRLVADELATLHLPFAAAEEFALMESIEVRDLVALLDALASTQHRLSLAHALRSPVFGASDDDLIAIAEAASPHGDWWRALMSDVLERPVLVRARRLLARWQSASTRLPPHDLLDMVIAEGDVIERYAAAVPAERRHSALAAIDSLVAQSLARDGGRYATPYNFVRALKRRPIKVAPPVLPAAVQLLTVHGAKGLEAQVVFVVDSDPTPKSPEVATLLIDWPVEASHPACCAFVYSEAQCPQSLVPLLDRELAARRREELNGLYVAMSRAKERLVFSCTAPHRAPTDAASWWQRIEPVADAWWPAPMGQGDATDGARALIRSLPTWPTEKRPRRKAAPEPATSNDENRRLGEAVHRVLEWAASPASAEADIAALAVAAADEFGIDSARVARLAGAIWHSPSCAPFLRGPAIRWAGNEVSVADGDDVLRIDRLVALERGGVVEWWVLDYKLEHRPGDVDAYRDQIGPLPQGGATAAAG